MTKLNQYRIAPDIIGKGAFSVFHLGRYQTGYPVAIKKLNRRKLESETKWTTDSKSSDKAEILSSIYSGPGLLTLMDRVREEIELVRGLRHRNVTHLLDSKGGTFNSKSKDKTSQLLVGVLLETGTCSTIP